MGTPKAGISSDGREMHYSVGAVIELGGRYLLIDRVKPPLGFAGIAGHVDAGEDVTEALRREVREESGLEVEKYEPLFEEEVGWNVCSRGVPVHYWYLFRCGVSGDVRHNILEAKSIGWYSVEDIRSLKLEPVWEYWFKKLGIL